MHTTNDPSAIFTSRDPELLDEQLANLQKRIKGLSYPRYEDLAFSWSAKPMLIRGQEKERYMAQVLHAYQIPYSSYLMESEFLPSELLHKNYL